MAPEGVDPRTFKSWEEVFNYPIPIVRKLEVQLRSIANENREKLRTLVGASYRDLLGTAERIVEMDENMRQVDTILGQVGKRCNSRIVDRIFDNYVKLDGRWHLQSSERCTFASQLSMLQACPLVISRQLRKGGSVLLAAKVIVLSRLLHKTLSRPESAPPLIDKLRDQLGALRRRLLARINRQLTTPEADVPSLVETMCAFSLATSSTPTDVLKHFHAVRLEAIKAPVEDPKLAHGHILRSLKLCVQTLQQTQAIFPKLLSQALARLKASPLIRNPDVQSVVELNLAIHERWVAEEVRNYTPWPRHDELQKADAERIMKVWARQAVTAALKVTEDALSNMKDLRDVVRLRQEMLEVWLSSSKQVPGLDPRRVLDDLRDTLNEHIKQLIGHTAKGARALVDGMYDAIDEWTPESASKTSIWDLSSTSVDLSDGAVEFKQSVINSSRGCNDAILKLISTYNTWTGSVSEIRQIIKEMRDARWDDDLEDDVDDDLGLESKQEMLGEDDPQILEEALDESLSKSFEQLHDGLRKLIERLSSSEPDAASQSVFILRILRETRQQLPRLSRRSSSSSSSSSSPSPPQPFAPDIIAPLHQKLARHVTSTSLATYQSSLDRISRLKRCPARTLWEGSPPLPLRPLPGTFKFLGALTRSMADAGADVWSPGAVRLLKTTFAEAVAPLLGAAVRQQLAAETDPPAVNGAGGMAPDEEEESPSAEPAAEADIAAPAATAAAAAAAVAESVRKDKAVQLLFDLAYLQCALKLRDEDGVAAAGGGAAAAVGSLPELESAAGLDETARAALHHGAREYWKKTYLLFALLA